MTKQILDLDLCASIRHFCYDSIYKFYERWQDQLGMSYITFSRALNGNKSTNSTIEKIEELSKSLGLYNKETGKVLTGRISCIRELVRHTDKVIDRFNVVSWSEFIDFYESIRGELLTYGNPDTK